MFAKGARRERRKQHRYNVHPPVAFSVGDGPFLPARCRDISLGGAFVETPTPALFGSRVRVQIWVTGPKGVERLSIDSVVRWTSREGFGVQFLALGARETHALVELFYRGVALAELAPPEPSAELPLTAEPKQGRTYFRASRARLQAYRRFLRGLVGGDVEHDAICAQDFAAEEADIRRSVQRRDGAPPRSARGRKAEPRSRRSAPASTSSWPPGQC